MPTSRQVKCSICGQPIKTMSGAIHLRHSAPVVCRRCFGEQTYAGTSHWTFSTATPDRTTSES